MPVFQTSFLPRTSFDMDQWLKTHSMGTSPIDMFDPYDELDITLSRNLHWIDKPEFLHFYPLYPKVPQKYRMTLDLPGFSPGSIKTELKDNDKIIIRGHEEHRKTEEEFNVKEFKRTLDLPENSEADKLVSFMTTGNKLVVEVPIKDSDKSPFTDMFPQIVENKDGSKFVTMRFSVPENVDHAKLHVNVKDRDLIFRAEPKLEKEDPSIHHIYYKRTSLPENTKFDSLKCVHEGNYINITAPLMMDFNRSYRFIPIEHKVQIKQKEKAAEEGLAQEKMSEKKEEKRI